MIHHINLRHEENDEDNLISVNKSGHGRWHGLTNGLTNERSVTIEILNLLKERIPKEQIVNVIDEIYGQTGFRKPEISRRILSNGKIIESQCLAKYRRRKTNDS